MISPESARTLQLITMHRRILLNDPDLPAETLRATLLQVLDAMEVLLLTLDQLEQAARCFLARAQPMA